MIVLPPHFNFRYRYEPAANRHGVRLPNGKLVLTHVSIYDDRFEQEVMIRVYNGVEIPFVPGNRLADVEEELLRDFVAHVRQYPYPRWTGFLLLNMH